MKKILVLILSISVVVALVFVILNLRDKSGRSDGIKKELIDFAVKDIESVDKIKITDRLEREYTLIKKGDTWTGEQGQCVTQEKVDWILDAFKNVRFKGYLSDASIKRFNTQMAAQHIKVEIFQNGEWTKTWYIGPTTQDHYGQIMLLESKEAGKSSVPVTTHLENMKGIIDPRFHADPMQWQCTNIFKLGISEIEAVNVKFNDEPQRSFSVQKTGQEVKVFQNGQQLEGYTPQDTYRYLNNYQKVHYDVPNYVLNKRQVDSVKRQTPFCVLTVNEVTGKSTTLKMFRIVSKGNEKAAAGEVLDPDLNNFWCELPSGNLVKCQYFVFSPLIMGHVYFPLDLTGVETIDGIRKRQEGPIQK